MWSSKTLLAARAASRANGAFAQLIAQCQAKSSPYDVGDETVGEMSAFCCLRRLLTIETRFLDNSIEKRQETDDRDRLARAFSDLAASNELDVLGRHENKLHRTYQRSLNKCLVLRELGHDENYQTNLDSDKPC